MGFFVLLVYPSLAASRTFLQQLLVWTLLWFRRFILLRQMTSYFHKLWQQHKQPWKWVRMDLIFSMRDIYINSNLNPLTKITSSSRSTEFKDILPWIISQMIDNIIPISTTLVKSNAMKQGIPWVWCFEFGGKSIKIETITWSEFHTSVRWMK